MNKWFKQTLGLSFAWLCGGIAGSLGGSHNDWVGSVIGGTSALLSLVVGWFIMYQD